MTILGISLGGRTTGIAIIKDGELLVNRSLTVRNKDSVAYATIIDDYVRQYRIGTAVVKTPPKSHISDWIKEIFHVCIEVFSYHGCMVEVRETKSMKAQAPMLTNKAQLLELAASSYPDLLPIKDREKANRQKYHVKMFEAVVVAHLKRTENKGDYN